MEEAFGVTWQFFFIDESDPCNTHVSHKRPKVPEMLRYLKCLHKIGLLFLYYTRLDKSSLFPYQNCMKTVCIDASIKESTEGGLAPVLWRTAVGRLFF